MTKKNGQIKCKEDVLSSVLQFYFCYAKSSLLIVLNLYPCAQSHGQRDVFTVLYWITANNYIITHICLQTALHLHRSVPCWKQDNNSLVHLQKIQVLNMYSNLFRVIILPRCESLKRSHLWKMQTYKILKIYLKKRVFSVFGFLKTLCHEFKNTN